MTGTGDPAARTIVVLSFVAAGVPVERSIEAGVPGIEGAVRLDLASAYDTPGERPASSLNHKMLWSGEALYRYMSW
jgi:hypothetical protein